MQLLIDSLSALFFYVFSFVIFVVVSIVRLALELPFFLLFSAFNLVLHFVLIIEKLSYHLHFFQVLVKLALSHGVAHHLFHVKFIFLAVGQSSKSVFFVTDFLLELALESFVDLITQESFLSAIIIDEIRLKTTNESNFSDLFLSFHALSEFIFFGEVG
jgi:hypothetical protein